MIYFKGMIKRNILPELLTLLSEYPVVTLLGPRQSGKTTLVKHFLKDYDYSNLEHPETRQIAENDPKAYLAKFTGKVIIDEIQRVPELLSYIQVMVDESPENGRFILTGSHQLQLQEAVGQSLAGRTAVLTLLPLSIAELSQHGISYEAFTTYCLRGFYPRIYDQEMRPRQMYANYYRTYVERDVRLLIQLKDVALFEKFIKLLAGRVGQLADYSALANDVSVDAKTIKHWISILEASFIVFKLIPYYENFGKRVIKSPKYYFTDVGLLCYILGIETENQLTRDPLVGNIFENLIVLEAAKTRFNQGLPANLYFFRDSYGNEVDIVFQKGRELVGIEIKSSSTFFHRQLKGLEKFKQSTDQCTESFLIYNGENIELSNQTKVLNFKETASVFKATSGN